MRHYHVMSHLEFEHIASQLRPLVLAVARQFFRAVGNAYEAEDVTQEVMLKLWRMGDRLTEVRNHEAWAVRMAKNQCISRYRQLQSRDIRSLDGVECAGGSVPDEHLLAVEDAALLRQILETLPSATQRLLRMRNIEGMSLDEIASVCGRSKASVKTTISTARRQIVERLKQER